MLTLQTALKILTLVVGAFLAAELIQERKTPGSTWGWLLIIAFIPYVGVPLYLIFGRRKIKRRGAQRQILYRSEGEVTILLSGEEAYRKMIQLISNAKKNIWITTFILGNDAVASEILALLTEQAKKGIEVRLLLDGFGSFLTPRIGLWKLRKAGGKFAFFLPLVVVPFVGHPNLRNHRKLMIVDHTQAILGGMNLAREYLGKGKDPKRWIDLSFLVEGKGAQDLAAIFRDDWSFAHSKEKDEEQSPTVEPAKPGFILRQQQEQGETHLGQPSFHLAAPTALDSSTIQIIGSGPDVLGDPLYDSILSSIFGAQKRIWMATPYFIPDETLAKALELACRRGVDVRLITPKTSNHPLADFCRRSYLRQIEEAGGRVCFDRHVMMHAKVTLFDDSYAVVGSANLDMRSLLLNYELGLFIYSKKHLSAIADWFLALEKQGETAKLKRGFGSEFFDGIGRILGPML